jgi:hypothetical protein
MFKPGQIGFIMHNGNWISKAIAWVMRSKWSHSFLVLGEFQGRFLVCETSDFQVTINNVERYIEDPNCSMEVYELGELDEADILKMSGAVDKMNGELYGYLQLFSLGVRSFFSLFDISVHNFIHQGMVCCAVPIYGLLPTSLNLQVDPESINTEELYQVVKSKAKMVYAKRTIENEL